ncbi:NlpC/P60 family protein [Actinoallomurus spadix]|uniref:NlpC/P60 family protein n=1 Tax=Actinoallomurus spadix TaxID=79912 RepID=A0ABP3GZQ7_9ACTN|nr:NlpC/P60 family protein [Actinoallomurus spadix]MCO5987003.1 NlpC/P60 family protein [Actinoallomurus spadix]
MKLRRHLRLGVGSGGRNDGRRIISLLHFTRSDQGAVRLPIIIAGGAAALFFMSLVAIPLFFGANNLFQNMSGANCTDTSGAGSQPQQSSDANGIPSNYLELYKKAGQQYGIPWNVLAGIGWVETHHGQLKAPGVSSGENYAHAGGPMQFIPGTWAQFGVDGNGDGKKSRYDPADAIPAAARYLKHNGAPQKMRSAIFMYNHLVSYVNNVLSWAKKYASGNFDVVQANGPSCSDVNGAPVAPSAVAAKVIAYEKAQIGKPYVYGATGPNSFDCSGLTMSAYKSAGVTIPRLSDDQYWWGALVPRGQEQPGDLVFFEYLPGHTGPGHVGTVYNPQKGIMIVAPHTGDVVKYQNYKTYPGGAVGFTRPTAHNGHNGPTKRL